MFQRIREASKNESGFTLIELLIVIVILGVLAGIVVFAVGGINDRGEKSACKADLKTVEVAVEAFYAKNSAYPVAGAPGLTALKDAGLLKTDVLNTGVTLAAAGVVNPGPKC